jgi:hypothetical protein
MQDKDTKLSAFNQLFQPILSEKILKELKRKVDKYVKKLTTAQLFQVIVYAQIEQLPSLNDISNSFNDDDFSQCIGLESFSASQISRRLRDLPSEIIKLLFKKTVRELGTRIGFQKLNQELGRLYLIDSTTISLCLTKYPWALYRQTKSGVKLHLRLAFRDGMPFPDKAGFINAKVADKKQMDELVVEDQDALNVFDRGYLDYKKFNRYCKECIRFVTRLKTNAIIEVVQDLPVIPDGSVLKDQIVRLGNLQTKMEYPMRLIEVMDTKGERIVIISNDFSLKSEKIGAIYRYRWQIEIFFKWLKQHFYVKHFYGTSQPAVENQLYMALCTFCLLTLLKLETGYSKSLFEFTRILKTNFYEPFVQFVSKLRRRPSQKSRGRRKINYDQIYQFTEYQFLESLEAGHLNDLIYDPIVL